MRIEKISSFLAALIFGSFAITIVLELNFPANYNDFIVGNSTWIAGNKSQDLILWPVFILIYFLINLSFSKLHSNLYNNYSYEISINLSNHLILWTIPFFIGTAGILFGRQLDYSLMILSILAISFIGIATLVTSNSKVMVDPNFFSCLFLSIILISITPLAIAVLLSRFSIKIFNLIGANSFINLSYLILTFFLIFSLILISNKKSIIFKNFPKIIFFVQLFLPLFYVTLFPAKLLLPTGEITTYSTTIYLIIFLTGLILFSFYDVTRRFWTYKTSKEWTKLFSPIAIYSLIVVFKIGNTFEPHISTDDYHFGERLLGWWTFTKGYIPYIDLLPAHGLIDDYLNSFFSAIFFNGTAATLIESNRVTIAILGLIAFLSINNFSKSIFLSFIILLLIGGRLTSLFLIPFITLWLNQDIRKNSDKWFGVWLLSIPLVILGAPPQGLLLVVAFSFLIPIQIWKIITDKQKFSYKFTLFSFVIISIFLISTPLAPMLFNAVRYVVENGPINQVAYGIPWNLSWDNSFKSGLIFEIFRMSWVIISLLCVYIIHKNWKNYKDATNIFYTAIIFLSFLLLLIPYTMGRIDPGSFSRPGLISILSWTFFFPVLIMESIQKRLLPLLILLFVFISSLLGFSTLSFDNIRTSIKPIIKTSALTDSTKLGLNNIGLAHVDPVQLKRISTLNSILNSKLKSDESYLDLTSRNAHYFYVNRLPLIPITSPYNLPGENQQRNSIKNLKTTPKLALLQADNILHDGGGLALRNPFIYRYILENYIPKYEKGFIIGYKKDLLFNSFNIITAEVKENQTTPLQIITTQQESYVILSDPILVRMLKIGDQLRFNINENMSISKISIDTNKVWFKNKFIFLNKRLSEDSVDFLVSPQVFQEYNASLFHRAFSTSDFKRIPFAWGKSAKNLEKRMSLIKSLNDISPQIFHLINNNEQYQINGTIPNLTFNINSDNISGKSAGLLKFDFNCLQKNEDPKLQLFWWGDDRSGPFEASSVIFSGDTGTLIVPLDASPWWYTLQKIKGIRIGLLNPSACSAISINKIGLYQRN